MSRAVGQQSCKELTCYLGSYIKQPIAKCREIIRHILGRDNGGCESDFLDPVLLIMYLSPGDPQVDTNGIAYPPIITDIEYGSHFPTSYRTLSSHLDADVNEGKENAKRTQAVKGRISESKYLDLILIYLFRRSCCLGLAQNLCSGSPFSSVRVRYSRPR